MEDIKSLNKLFDIATENGWQKSQKLQDAIDWGFHIEDNNIEIGWSDSYSEHTYSINDIVTEYEEYKVSFVEALYRALYKISHKELFYSQEDLCCLQDLTSWENIIQSWSMKKYYCRFEQCYKHEIRPTSKRLDWFLDLFKQLL